MSAAMALSMAAALALTAGACRRGSPPPAAPAVSGEVIARDDFESETLSEHWETKRFLPGAVRVQGQVLRSGAGAAEIVLRAGDQIPSERGTELERAELEEATTLRSQSELGYEFWFSLRLPADFPVVDTRLVLAQWKQACPVASCTPNNPNLAVRYQNGELLLALQTTDRKQVLWRTRQEIRGRWLDFRVRVRFSPSDRGRVQAWLGSERIADHQGPTAYPPTGGHISGGTFYFKMGLYRDRMPATMTVFIDDYAKRALRSQDF